MGIGAVAASTSEGFLIFSVFPAADDGALPNHDASPRAYPPFGAAQPVLLSGARQTQIWSICAAVTRTLEHDADERTPTQAD